MSKLSDQIREFRQRFRFSMPQLAEKTGVPKENLYKWEKGTKPTDIEAFHKLVKFMEDYTFESSTKDVKTSMAEEPTTYYGQNPHTKSEYYEKIIEEKDRTIEQLRDTINALTTAVKSISGNPDNKQVSRSTSGAKTH